MSLPRWTHWTGLRLTKMGCWTGTILATMCHRNNKLSPQHASLDKEETDAMHDILAAPGTSRPDRLGRLRKQDSLVR